jgi:hypothetical protein
MSDDHRLLHIGFGSVEMTEAVIDGLKRTFDEATTWMRYSPNCWMLWTGRTIDEWQQRIAATPELPKNFTVLILTVMDGRDYRGGFAYDWMWKWLQERKK